MDKSTIQRLFAQAHGGAYTDEPHDPGGHYMSLMFTWSCHGLMRSILIYQWKNVEPIKIEASAAHPTQPLTTGWPTAVTVPSSVSEIGMLKVLKEAVKTTNNFTEADLQKA